MESIFFSYLMSITAVGVTLLMASGYVITLALLAIIFLGGACYGAFATAILSKKLYLRLFKKKPVPSSVYSSVDLAWQQRMKRELKRAPLFIQEIDPSVEDKPLDSDNVRPPA